MAKGFIAGILEFLFPPRCVFCRSVLKSREKDICAQCTAELPRNEGGFVRVESELVSRCVSPLYYRDNVRESILRYKFRGFTQYAQAYGKLLAGCVKTRLSGQYDLITWVPLSEKREKKRGYNQAMLLALATALELDDVAADTLSKVVEAPAQSGIEGAEERRQNVSNAFVVSDPELVEGRRVLIIDDIVTTGATLAECARVLREAGAVDVCCAALACRESKNV